MEFITHPLDSVATLVVETPSLTSALIKLGKVEAHLLSYRWNNGMPSPLYIYLELFHLPDSPNHQKAAMRLVAALLLFMISTSYSREVLGSRPLDGKSALQEDSLKVKAGHPDSNIDNHHSIPRQFFNNQGGSSKIGEGGDDNDNGGGA
uniref:Uncharacterized protein n=2 Tax=Kalanchoe fedtschenkoi TaxID=63787 RepID=A0A7N0RH16_KALFE